MKWLTTILTVYLLGLSLWPCADEPLTLAGQPEISLSIQVREATESSHGHAHLCSPLCACACCATTLTAAPRFLYTLNSPAEILFPSSLVFAYYPPHWVDPLSAIWQPPKLTV
ncbi:DUF6660 family protein [Tellurirhabdus bombi]|uniref:DUF6660 family protein n=1 Tax=Tellurirhabdus bombi TaxID=2907205 RepID=UPI001F4018EC|nr:DUF6660 family protein [Tellurirhabdus bombi]